MTTKGRRLGLRLPAAAVAVLALAGVVLTTLPAEEVSAAPAAVEGTARAQATAPVRPASFGRKLGGVNPSRTGPLVLGLTVADLGDPSTVAAPPAPAARIPAVPRITTTAKPGTSAAAAIAFALAQRGLPYVWGGDGPQSGEDGFDCSGLTTAAYDWAGVSLPRTAHTQYYAGPHLPADAPLEPGDLVFYGVPERVHHVGLYLGNGRMINAPTFGRPVRTAFVRYPGDDYLGATRPAAGRDAPGLLEEPDLPFDVPPVPAPDAPPGPAEFSAPPAPDDPPATPTPGAQALAPPTEGGVLAAPEAPASDAPTAAAAPGGSATQVPSPGPSPDGPATQLPSPGPSPDGPATELPPTGPAAEGPAGPTTMAGSAPAGAAPSAGSQGGDASTTAGETRPSAGDTSTTRAGETTRPPAPPAAGTLSAGASATTPPETGGAPNSPTTGDPTGSASAQATTTPPSSSRSADGPSSAPGESGARATTPGASSAPASSAPASSAPESSAPASSAPNSSAPNSSAPAQATTAPAASTPSTDASTTRPPGTDARATSPPPTSTPAQATTAPAGGNAEATASSPPSSADALPPNTVGLPDGETLGLVTGQAGGDRPVAAPTGAGTAAVMRSGGTTVITLPPTTGTVGLSRGGTIQLTDSAGKPAEFDVQSKRTVDADTAAEVVASGDNRLVLLQPRDDGEVLLVLAS